MSLLVWRKHMEVIHYVRHENGKKKKREHFPFHFSRNYQHLCICNSSYGFIMFKWKQIDRLNKSYHNQVFSTMSLFVWLCTQNLKIFKADSVSWMKVAIRFIIQCCIGLYEEKHTYTEKKSRITNRQGKV